MNRWWRAYDEAVDDPKLQCLSAELFRFWFNICCVCSQFQGRLPSVFHLAFKLKMQQRKVVRLLDRLRLAGLIDEDNEGIRPHNWHKRQYISDLSTPRVKRFRNVSAAVSETAPDYRLQSTEKKKKRDATHLLKKKMPPFSMPADFEPDREFPKARGWPNERIDTEAQRFRDHASMNGRTCKDWQAAWRNWVTSPFQQEGNGNGRGPRPFQDDSKSASRAAGRLAEAAERGEFTFGPKPGLLPEPRKDDALLLPPRRSSRS